MLVASNSKFDASIFKFPPSNFIYSVASPTLNSGSALLFPNQNPAVVSVTEILPVLITDSAPLPLI